MSELAKIEQPQLPADPMVSMIERIAMDPNSDLDKLQRMLDMKERHDAQQAKAAFDAAFAEASAEFPKIPLRGKNKHQGTSYALLEDILSGVRPVLARHGFAISFSTEVDKESVTVTAELSHKAGHSKRNSIPLPRDTGAGRNAVQAVGSSQTYGQRYTAQAILGLSLGDDTDDDGRGATAAPEQPSDAEIQALQSRLSGHPDSVRDWFFERYNITELDQISVAQLREANVMLTKREAAAKAGDA